MKKKFASAAGQQKKDKDMEELVQLLAAYNKRLDKMSPEERAAFEEAQIREWAKAEAAITEDPIDRIIAEHCTRHDHGKRSKGHKGPRT